MAEMFHNTFLLSYAFRVYRVYKISHMASIRVLWHGRWWWKCAITYLCYGVHMYHAYEISRMVSNMDVTTRQVRVKMLHYISVCNDTFYDIYMFIVYYYAADKVMQSDTRTWTSSILKKVQKWMHIETRAHRECWGSNSVLGHELLAVYTVVVKTIVPDSKKSHIISVTSKIQMCSIHKYTA